MNQAACTIVSFNYLPYARTLCQSFLRVHPGQTFYVLLVDRIPEGFDLSKELFETILVENLDIPEFLSIAFKYDILELNTAVKPTFFKKLFALGLQRVIYFDPDIYIYSSLDFIFDTLRDANIVLTPHITQPITDELRPPEREFLVSGTFNLGFIGVAASKEGLRFLDWWERRCLSEGYRDTQAGLFVDQKWINLAPYMFNGVQILNHAGCNVAYWNLHEREITAVSGNLRVNGSDTLLFFHFSGFSAGTTARISKYTDRYTLSTRPDVAPLFSVYRSLLHQNRLDERIHHKYSFGYYSNGDLITGLARSVFGSQHRAFGDENPFNACSNFYRFAKKNGLVSRDDAGSRLESRVLDRTDRRYIILNSLVRSLLRILGANRYTMLMRYLNFISNPRNQRDILTVSIQSNSLPELPALTRVIEQ